MEMLREVRRRRHDEKDEKAADVFRCRRDILAIPFHHLGSVLRFPKHRTGIVRMDRMRPEEERGDDAEVAPAAADRPVKILVFLGAGVDEAAVGQHHVCGQNIVNCQAALACQVSEPAAQRQPADAGGRDHTGGRGQTERVSCVVHIAPGTAASDSDGVRGRIYARVLDARQVDDQTVIAYAESPGIVTTAPDCDEQVVLPADVDGRDNVRHVRTSRDQTGSPVDHAVVNLTGGIVALVVGLDQFTEKARLECFCDCFIYHCDCFT